MGLCSRPRVRTLSASVVAVIWPSSRRTLLAWLRRQDRSAVNGVGVVVAVGLPEMLGVGVDMRLVVMFHGRMVVLMRVSRRHVFPLGAMPQVMHQVSVLVGDGVMGVHHGLPLVTYSRRNLLPAPDRTPLTMVAPDRRSTAGNADGAAAAARFSGRTPGTDVSPAFPVKTRACGAISLRRHCPDQVPGGRHSAW